MRTRLTVELQPLESVETAVWANYVPLGERLLDRSTHQQTKHGPLI
jgi:hypothetical protein